METPQPGQKTGGKNLVTLEVTLEKKLLQLHVIAPSSATVYLLPPNLAHDSLGGH